MKKKQTVVMFIVGLWLIAGIVAGAEVPKEAGLIACWSFDEGEGGTVKDVSGNGNDGNIHEATWVEGISGKALCFGFGDNYVDCGNKASLNAIDAMTIEAWIYPKKAPGGYAGVVSKDRRHTSAGAAWSFDFTWGGTMMFEYRYTPGEYDSSHNRLYAKTTLKLNTWNHVVVTFRDGVVTHYLNGREDATKTFSQPRIITVDYPLEIGRAHNKYFDGVIDEVAIYNRALSASEIKSHHDMRRPLSESRRKSLQGSFFTSED